MQRRRMLWPLPYSLSPLHAPSTATAISKLNHLSALHLKFIDATPKAWDGERKQYNEGRRQYVAVVLLL